MSRGGARPNSGPKKGTKHHKTINAQHQREVFNRMVDAKWDKIVTAQINAAIRGDVARQYTINQRIGKAVETVFQQLEVKGLILDV